MDNENFTAAGAAQAETSRSEARNEKYSNGDIATDAPLMFTRRSRPNHTKPWCADDIENLAGLIFTGRTIPQIAQALGRSQEAVRTKANDLDFLPKRARKKTVSTVASSIGA